MLISLPSSIRLIFFRITSLSIHDSLLSVVVKNYVVKKAVYDHLAAKVKNINTSAFVLKTNIKQTK